MYYKSSLFVVFITVIFITMMQVFGTDRKAPIKFSNNKGAIIKDGKFTNQEPTPVMSDSTSGWKVFKEMLRGAENGAPSQPITTTVFDKKAFLLPSDSIKYVWFGHSTILLNIQGTILLCDPVFSQYASPVPFTNGSFKYSNEYLVSQLPQIDAVIISHDHYDHLDKKTIKALKLKTKQFFVPLGVDAHLKNWGIDSSQIETADWWDSLPGPGSLRLVATPARHFSGRGLTRNTTLWCSWVIMANNQKVYFGGDSGYGGHFAQIGEHYGPFNLSFLECGQYNANWPLIHSFPEQTVQAAIDIKSNLFVPIHWGKFKLSLHSWTEPITLVTNEANRLNVPMAKPVIGAVNYVSVPENSIQEVSVFNETEINN